MVTDQRPYQAAKKDYHISLAISQGKMPAEVATLNVEAMIKTILVECWRAAPESRPSMHWCLQHLSKRLCGTEVPLPGISPQSEPSSSPDENIALTNAPLAKKPGKNRRRRDKAKSGLSNASLPSTTSQVVSITDRWPLLAVPPFFQTPDQNGSTHTSSIDLTSLSLADSAPCTPPRKKLQLLQRSTQPTEDNRDDDDYGDETRAEANIGVNHPQLTNAHVKRKLEEDVKEFFVIRDLAEGERSFQALPEEHRSKLVDKLIGRALESTEDDIKLVADLFASVAGTSCSPASFEVGFAGTIEFLDDIAIDVPQTYPFMARLLRGSKLPQSSVEELAAKIYVDGDPVVRPKDKLLAAFAKTE